jgi:hypothetical protein
MIDSADESSGRNYDFPNVVRSFAERADLILFFFDPDKPGTTGETMKVFLHALQGLEHKLLIIMNKVDQFANIRDFARAYGALCWNLSKVIRTKDMPHIYNTYLPELVRESKHQEQQIALTDFDISRDEVVHEIERTPARRADNLVTALRDHSRVCAEVAGRVRKLKRQAFMLTALLVVAAGGLGWLGWLQNWRWGIGLFLGFLAVAAGIYYLGRVLVGREKEHLENGLDGVFEDLYARDLALDDRADLRALWESVKPGVKTTLHAVGADKLPGPRGIRKHISRIDKTLNEEVPRMRRTLEMAKPRMEEEAGSATPSPSTA